MRCVPSHRLLIVAAALCAGWATIAPAQQPPPPAATAQPETSPSPSLPPSGFAEAPARAANPQSADFVAPPANYVFDPGYLLDPARRSKLEIYLETQRRATGIRVYLAAYPSLRDEAPSTRAVRLQTGWVQTGLGGVLVYGSDSRRFGVAVSRGTIEILPPGTLQGLLERCERNLRNSKNVALTLREGAMDLEFELRSALKARQRKQQRTAPLRVSLIVGIGAALLVGSTFLIHHLRVQNLFGHSHRFLRRPDGAPRYGGLCSGGTCAVVKFGDPPQSRTR